MNTDLKLTLAILVAVVLSPLFCFAETLSSAELINNAEKYDGKTIAYAGEAIGDVMLRGKNAWVNINDGNRAIGVWMSASLAGEISHTGSYKSSGDRIEVTGIFHRACPEHGGDLDIHAKEMRKIANGGRLTEKIDPAKKQLSFILGGALALLWILTLLKSR